MRQIGDGRFLTLFEMPFWPVRELILPRGPQNTSKTYQKSHFVRYLSWLRQQYVLEIDRNEYEANRRWSIFDPF